jgi:predicted secreted protein
MMAKILLFVLICLNSQAFGSEHQKIDTLGVSSKGQYVALEEYGYKADQHTYYVTIKFINVWKKEYVGSQIEVVSPAHRPDFLVKAREKAKILAHDQLKQFNING